MIAEATISAMVGLIENIRQFIKKDRNIPIFAKISINLLPLVKFLTEDWVRLLMTD